ncbi:MAG: response regulator [Alphaproteobacteria bacterium]|nr:response regulator [Alphaproteobacteria bacterium]
MKPKQTIVCVIDDNDDVRQLICRALQGAGFATVDAGDGDAGARAVRQSNPSIVVTDMVMECCDGVETIMELKRNSPAVRILAISGGGTRGGRDLLELAECAGADACLAKPFRVGDLIHKVTELALAA